MASGRAAVSLWTPIATMKINGITIDLNRSLALLVLTFPWRDQYPAALWPRP